MSRPINPDRRDCQVKFRFTAAELALLTQHALTCGMPLNTWGRAQLLAAIKAKPKAALHDGEPRVALALPASVIATIRQSGLTINDAAHIANGSDGMPGLLTKAVSDFDALMRQHAAALIAAPTSGVTLEPATRHQLKKIAVNLTQVERRLETQKIPPPEALTIWAARLRDLLNGEVRAP